MENEYPLGKFLHERRTQLGLTMRELSRKIDDSRAAGGTVSFPYYSQVESGKGIKPEKISMDFFWAVSVVLGTDPLELFILSRPNIPRKMLNRKLRLRLFDKLYVTEETV